MELMLSLPTEIQIEILSYLDLESQISAATACESWAEILLYNHRTQLARRSTKPHGETGYAGLPIMLDSGRRGWYTKTVCDHGTVYTYLFLRPIGRDIDLFKDVRQELPDINKGRDITGCPLLYDLVFPPRELLIRQPPRTVIRNGTVTVNQPLKRVKRKPLCPFFLLVDASEPSYREQTYSCNTHFLQATVMAWRNKTIPYSVYKKVTVGDFAQVGVDILWDLHRTRNPRLKSNGHGGIYQLFVGI